MNKENTAPETEVRNAFACPPSEYGPVPFYWWVGDTLTRERLAWQLDRLKDKGIMNSVISYSHTPQGATDLGDPPLFSEAWWELLRWVVAECKKRGMYISFQDYTIVNRTLQSIAVEVPGMLGGSLQHTGQLVSGPARVSLAIEPDTIFLRALAYPVVDGQMQPDLVQDLSTMLNGPALYWEAPSGEWQVVLLSFSPSASGGFDPMHPQAGRKAIEKLYAVFEENCPGALGSTIAVFFQDELDFHARMPFWSNQLPEEFKKRKGYDLLPVLPALWYELGPQTPKIRIDYADVCVQLLEESYFIPIFDWHQRRGTILANDNSGRGGIAAGRAYYGDYFRTMRWYTAPGNDDPNLHGPRAFRGFKVNSSIAHLYQRPRVWNEAFHSSGWGVSPAQVLAGLHQDYVFGATVTCLHGLYYSIYGGWWEWAPPDFHFRQPYWDHSEALWHYIRRLSYLLSQGVHRCDVGIIYPITTIEAGPYAREAEEHAFGLAHYLFESGIDFDLIDFESLERASAIGGELQVSGEVYRVLLLPMMGAVRRSTMEKVAEFARAGGTVIAYGCLPGVSERAGRNDPELDALVEEVFGVQTGEAEPSTGSEDKAAGLGVLVQGDYEQVKTLIDRRIARDFIPGADHLYALHRQIGDLNVYFVYNHSDTTRSVQPMFRCEGRCEVWDAWTGVTRPGTAVRSGCHSWVQLELAPQEARLVVLSPEGPPATSLAVTDACQGRRVSRQMLLEGPWDFRLIPTLDNQYGDFRLPAHQGFSGAEAKQFRYAEEAQPEPAWHAVDLDDSDWPLVTYSFGPRMWKLGPLPDSSNTSALEQQLRQLTHVDPSIPVTVGGRDYWWAPYHFSLRWGIERDAFLTNRLAGPHGPKKAVPDEFIDLGGDEPGSIWYMWTAVVAPRAGKVPMVMGSRSAYSSWVNGTAAIAQAAGLPPGRYPAWNLPHYESEQRSAGIALRQGANPLLLRFTILPAGWYESGWRATNCRSSRSARWQTAPWHSGR